MEAGGSSGAGGRSGRWLRAGRIGRPHGLDGSFHVAGASLLLLSPGATVLVGADGPARLIERRAGHEGNVIVRLEGCSDRDSADALRGIELYAAREAAPPLEEDEWWAEELEGCTVYDGERLVGVVERLVGMPSCELLEVARDGAPAGAEPLLVPLVSDAVRSVDVAARRV